MKGKIYWVDDIFQYHGRVDEESCHIVANIENVVIQEYMIKFFILKHNVDVGKVVMVSYNVNLKSDDGIKYIGDWNDDEDRDYFGVAKCELYSNKSKYFLFGTWEESGTEFTWWANIQK